MGYRVKKTSKNERKKGVEAAKRVGADGGISEQVALAVAKLNKAKFEEIDEYDDAQFCVTMQDWRENVPDAYAVFWWWRLAWEHSAKHNEEDPDFKEPEFRQFTIVQYLAAPFDFTAWKQNRYELRKGVKPWIDEEQIQAGLAHRSITRWAYGLHWRDVYTSEDEITDRDCLRKAGQRKFAHWHVVCEARNKVTLSQVCRWFDVPPTQVKILKGAGAFRDMLEYLPHLSPAAIEDGKTVYDLDEFICSPGLDLEKEIRDLQENRIKYGSRAGSMSADDTMRMRVLRDGWTLSQCEEDDPLTFAKPGVEANLKRLRLRYLMKQPPVPLRLNFYIDGPGRVGKGTASQALADALFPLTATESNTFSVGKRENVTFEGYDGEPCIIWSEWNSDKFLSGDFGIERWLAMFDTHPEKSPEHVKMGKVLLVNSVNIINGTEPFEQFVDKMRKAAGDDESMRQVGGRFPMVLNLRDTDFDVLFNVGFLGNDSYAYNQWDLYRNVRGNFARIAQKLDGEAKRERLALLTAPAVELVGEISNVHDDKVSDPSQLPDEFADYGAVYTAEELEERALEREIAEHIAYEEWLFEFMVLEHEGAVPNGWRRCYQVDGVWHEDQEDDPDGSYNYGDKKPAHGDMPLTFAQWRQRHWEQLQETA